MDKPDNHVADAAFEALFELFSSPKVRSHAHFSCCTDGPTEFDKAFDSAMKEAFGPTANRKKERWVKRLRRLGLIP